MNTPVPPIQSGAGSAFATILANGIAVIGAGLETFRSSLQSVGNTARSLFANALDTIRHASTDSPIPKSPRIVLVGLTTKEAGVEDHRWKQPPALTRRLSTEEGKSGALQALRTELAGRHYNCTPPDSHTTSLASEHLRDDFHDPDDESSDADSVCTTKDLTQIGHVVRSDKVSPDCTDLEPESPPGTSIHHETRRDDSPSSIDDIVLTPEEDEEYQRLLAQLLYIPTPPSGSDEEALSFDEPIKFGKSPRIYVASISAPKLKDIAEDADHTTTFAPPANASIDSTDTVSLDSWRSEPTSSDDERDIALSSRSTAVSGRRMWQTPDQNDLEADLAKLSESYRQQWGSSETDSSDMDSADEAAIDVENTSDADEAHRIADKFRSALEAAETFDSSVKSLRKTIRVPDVRMQRKGQHRLI